MINKKMQHELPKFSLVIPSFNQAEYIGQTLDSIKQQSYKNYEVIVIDGGSTDKTLKLINEEYYDVVTILVSEPDLGQSDALNKGFALATGDIMGWMNSDDLYSRDAFELAVQAFHENPQVSVVFGDWTEIADNSSIVRTEYAFNFSKTQTIYEGAQMNCQAMFWRAEVQNLYSGFDLELQTSMDYQFLLEISLKLKSEQFLRVPKVLGSFRRYEGQKTDGSQKNVYVQEHHYIVEKYHINQKINSLGYLIKIVLKFRRLWWYLKRGGVLYTIHRVIGARRMFRREIL